MTIPALRSSSHQPDAPSILRDMSQNHDASSEHQAVSFVRPQPTAGTLKLVHWFTYATLGAVRVTERGDERAKPSSRPDDGSWGGRCAYRRPARVSSSSTLRVGYADPWYPRGSVPCQTVGITLHLPFDGILVPPHPSPRSASRCSGSYSRFPNRRNRFGTPSWE